MEDYAVIAKQEKLIPALRGAVFNITAMVWVR